MRHARILTPVILSLLAGNSTAHAVDRPHYDALYDAAETNVGRSDIRAPKRKVSISKPAQSARQTPVSPVIVASSEVRRDAPSFVWAGRMRGVAPVGVTDPRVAARFHLDKLATIFDLSDSAVAAAVVKNVHDTGRGGIVVSIGQDVDGVEVFRDRMNLLLQRNLALVAVGGGLHRFASVHTKFASNRWLVPRSDAIANALGDLYEISVNGTNLVEIGILWGSTVSLFSQSCQDCQPRNVRNGSCQDRSISCQL